MEPTFGTGDVEQLRFALELLHDALHDAYRTPESAELDQAHEPHHSSQLEGRRVGPFAADGEKSVERQRADEIKPEPPAEGTARRAQIGRGSFVLERTSRYPDI